MKKRPTKFIRNYFYASVKTKQKSSVFSALGKYPSSVCRKKKLGRKYLPCRSYNGIYVILLLFGRQILACYKYSVPDIEKCNILR